ncbi:hypothetical protein PspLS_03111 [Pyricularia sp. CBS 133598]|nr:hypothetical protein PspLS_03111 [Pyricularia sp. CBS 133598]
MQQWEVGPVPEYIYSGNSAGHTNQNLNDVQAAEVVPPPPQQQQQSQPWGAPQHPSHIPNIPGTIQPMQAHNQSPFANNPWYSPQGHPGYPQADMSRRNDQQMDYRYTTAPSQQNQQQQPPQQHHPGAAQPPMNVAQQQQQQQQQQHQAQHGQHPSMIQGQHPHQQQHAQPQPHQSPQQHIQQHGNAVQQSPQAVQQQQQPQAQPQQQPPTPQQQQQQVTPTPAPAPAPTPRQRKRPAPSSKAAAAATPATGVTMSNAPAAGAPPQSPAVSTSATSAPPAPAATAIKPPPADETNAAPQPPPAKKSRTNTPWTAAEEHMLKQMRDQGLSWAEIAKSFPQRTEGSVKKHWYKDMHYAEFAENESQDLLNAIKEYESNKWKTIGQKVGKPAKACEQYAKEHFPELFPNSGKSR